MVAEAMWWVGCGGYVVGGGGVEKWRLKLTSVKVKVEVEAELGKKLSSIKKKNTKRKLCS